MKTHEQALFEDAPVWRAVTSLVVPTVISQVISVIYNMADTFFIGQIGDRNQVAAASLCLRARRAASCVASTMVRTSSAA